VIAAWIHAALDAVAHLGPWGPVLFIALYILACLLFLPGAPLTLGAGALFGVAKGFFLASTAATLGACAAFLAGRTLARGWVARRLAGDPRLRALDAAVGREGWKIVGLCRLSPLLPFNLLNYAFGLTDVRFRDYALASWIGMMPGALMYVYLGALAGDLAGLGGAGAQRSPAEWALFGLGLAATVAVALLVARLAREELSRKTGV